MNEQTGDNRANTGRERLDNVERSHDGSALVGEDDGCEKGGSGCGVHGLRTGAEDKEEHGGADCGGHGNEGEEDGGG